MLKKAKEVIVSANCRTKCILAVACVYLIVIFTTVTTGAVNQIMNYIPTVDIKLKDGVNKEKEYLVKQDTVENVLTELNVELNKGDTVNKKLNSIVEQNDLLKITRLKTSTITKVESIPYKTIVKGTGGWSKTVTQKGKKGKISFLKSVRPHPFWAKTQPTEREGQRKSEWKIHPRKRKKKGKKTKNKFLKK